MLYFCVVLSVFGVLFGFYYYLSVLFLNMRANARMNMRLTIINNKTKPRRNYITPTLQFEELERDEVFLMASPITEEGPDSGPGQGDKDPLAPTLAKESDFIFDETMPEVEYNVDFDF